MKKRPTLAALAADVIAACRIIDGKALIEAYGHDVPYDHYGRAWNFYRARFARVAPRRR